MGIDNSGSDSFMIHNSAGGVDSSSQFTINTNGKVGIGTTNPSTKLDVNGGSDNLLATFKSTDDLAYISFQDNGTTSNTSVALGANDNNLVFFTGTTFGTEKMRIASNGNVGIGDTPTFKLDVNVTSSRARFKASTGNADIELSSIDGHDWLMRSMSDDSFAIYDEDAATERMRIDSSGNVGIGTTAPSQKLHISGNMRLTGAFRDRLNSQGAANYVLTSTGSNGTQWVDASGSSIIGGPYLPLSAGSTKPLTGDLFLTLSSSTQRALSSSGTNSLQIGDAGVQELKFKNASGNSFLISASGNIWGS
jgi:hypothetical protein